MSFIRDLLFPKHCLVCGYLGAYICGSCRNKLRYVSRDRCFNCGRESLYGLTHPGCRRPYDLDGVMALLYYNDTLRAVIKNIKYRLVRQAFDDLFKSIDPLKIEKINFFKKLDSELFLCPIPLHVSRDRARGFNQAAIIADWMNNFLELEKSDLLIRKKKTATQAQLRDRRRRYQNLRGAFAAKTPTAGMRIILVDDVVTSGSTIREAARMLKRQGAARVYALSLAKG